MRILLILISSLSLFMIGCQKKAKRQVINGRQARQAPGIGAPGINNGNRTPIESFSGQGHLNDTWGQVITSSSFQSDFQYTVERLVSATIDPQFLGDVSAEGVGGTGVYFSGLAELSSGALSDTNMPRTDIDFSNSWLELVVRDSFSGDVDDDGNEVPDYPISFSSAESGYVEGNFAAIRFSDSYGEIILEGNFDSEIFSGTLYFTNFVSYDDSVAPAKDGVLGEFQIRTCAFFRCQ